MSGSTTPYGRTGPQADGDPKVAELLNRSTNGQFEAMTSLDVSLKTVIDNGRMPWSASLVDLTLFAHQWLAVSAWKRATIYLDSIINGNGLDDNGYRQIDMLCDQASRLSLNAISLKEDIKQGKKPGLKQRPENLTMLPLTQANHTAIWAIIESAFVNVQADQIRMTNLGMPAGMHKVQVMIEQAVRAKATVFGHLQTEWNAAMSAENRMQVVRQAIPFAEHFFTVNQQIWTPYQAGSVYTDIVRSTATFNRLNLSFDPWVLTDPKIVDEKVTDVTSCRELAAFWETIADPATAASLQANITDHVRGGNVTIQSGRSLKLAPWMPRYTVSADLMIGDVALAIGDEFTLMPRGSAGQRVLEIRASRP